MNSDPQILAGRQKDGALAAVDEGPAAADTVNTSFRDPRCNVSGIRRVYLPIPNGGQCARPLAIRIAENLKIELFNNSILKTVNAKTTPSPPSP